MRTYRNEERGTLTRTNRGRQGTYRQQVVPVTRTTRGQGRYELPHEMPYEHDGGHVCSQGQCLEDTAGHVYWEEGLGYVRYPEQEVVMYRNGNGNGNGGRHYPQRVGYIPRGGFLPHNGDHELDHEFRNGERFYGPIRPRNGHREFVVEDGLRVPRTWMPEEYGWYPEGNIDHGYGRVYRDEQYLIGGQEHAWGPPARPVYDEECVVPRTRSVRLRDEHGRFRPWDNR